MPSRIRIENNSENMTSDSNELVAFGGSLGNLLSEIDRAAQFLARTKAK